MSSFLKLSLLSFCLLFFTHHDSAAYEPESYGAMDSPGQMVDIGGYRLHIYCLGKGSPTVILDSGAGGFSLEWKKIQDGLSGQTRICAYDRAGYGWSEMGPLPRTSQRITSELYTLLKKAGIGGPYIIVGHSFGGYTAQSFARQFPRETVAMVLIDSSHPEQSVRLPETKNAPSRKDIHRSRTYIVSEPVVHQNFPHDLVPVAYRLMSSWKHMFTWREEMIGLPLSARQVLESGPSPEVPLVVLTRGQRVWPLNEYGNVMEQKWMEMQDDLGKLVNNPVHLIAERSGHSIHLDQPEMVITALRIVLDANLPGTEMKKGASF